MTAPIPRALALGLAAGAAVGLAEALGVASHGGLYPSLPAQALLAGAGAATGAALGVAGAGAVRLIGCEHGATAALGGGMAPVLASLGVWWASDPPPFTAPSPLQGAWWALGLFGIALPSLLILGTDHMGRRARWGVVGALGIAAAWTGWSQGGTSLGDPPVSASPLAPNLLLITVDTTRADRLMALGDTPSFDRLAREGVRFDLAISQIPVTGPSHTTILSGVPPWEHGMLLNGTPIPAQLQLLPEGLRQRGYATGAFVSGYVLNGNLGFQRGFQVYDDDFSSLPGMGRILAGRLWEMGRRAQDADHLLQRRGDLTTDRALAWLRDQRGPWFAWVHLFDPHGPYTPPPPWDERYYQGRDPHDPNNRSMEDVRGVAPYMQEALRGITDVDYVRARYDGELAWTDTQVGALLDWLDATGQTEDTMVVLVGDHGEGLGEHGEWFNHGDALWDQDLHVPLAMRLPDALPAGRVIPTPVELTDVAPTIADYLSLDLQRATGISLRIGIDGERLPRRTARSICLDRAANRAARALEPDLPPRWRMASSRGLRERVVVREAEGFADQTEVWRDDPPDEALWEALRADARALLATQAQGETSTSAGDRDLLEALGYVEP
ncbi:MAG: sulfatase [Deltaproteobacteria bacterium]|nr:sulfatase [Deltaproteobacteria bacterium]